MSTNTAFTIPASTPEQRRYRAVSLSREYVDAEFDKIAAQLQAEKALNLNNVPKIPSRQAEQDVHRTSLEHIFNPQLPTETEAERASKSAYIAQIGELVDNWRQHEAGDK